MKRLIFKKEALSLVELLVAVAVLSLGMLLIQQAFFISLSAFGYYSRHLGVLAWINEKLWAVQSALAYQGLNSLEPAGLFEIRGKKIFWNLSIQLTDQLKDNLLYEVILNLNWKEGRRKINLQRSTYILVKNENEPLQ